MRSQVAIIRSLRGNSRGHLRLLEAATEIVQLHCSKLIVRMHAK